VTVAQRQRDPDARPAKVRPSRAVERAVTSTAGVTDGAGDAPAATAPARRAPGGTGARHRLLVPVLAVLAALGLAGTAGFAWAWNGERSADAAQSAMADRARDFLIALTNFDGSTVDADFDRIVAYATGDFAAEADRFFGSDVRAALKEVQAASRGEIRSLYVQDFDGDQGRVFAVVDQTIANNRFPAPQADELRLDLGLQHRDGEWKVYDVKVLQAPAESIAPEAAATAEEGSSGD
jgi:hypothetical protein